MSTPISFDQSIRSFLKEAGSASPTPGGGSIAAVAAALGAAMTAMVGSLSQSSKFAEVKPQMDAALAKMNALTAECEQLMGDDITAFDAYMAALKLPKETEEQKLLRKQALQQAAAGAIAVPLRLLEACAGGIAVAGTIAEIANANVISDLGIGVLMLEAAAQSALLTVEINLPQIKDEGERSRCFTQADSLIRQMEAQKNSLLAVVRKRMNE
ncbi:cyclodeaminase/cyclohydrolase family protein [Paenibacillus protaetiae]|uniref:Methenyltetrahydrofolate cyclohydrolase n=1 Tax=Paenibacillus protaetiae TaxID=2509456 RepID=A0A4P6EWG8_9BACL|nr:cyclodeaminase/cyclohydrolase family protein [Paenibacillus protaetiae]QAY66955.1 methenyltetrahydrofolate cyclohydrolase [Paenibacillus protaetiae]